MPGKARVHELAKEFGVDSETVLAKLQERIESSTHQKKTAGRALSFGGSFGA